MAEPTAVRERADELQRANPDWRSGQAMFNALHELDPTTADRIRGTADDPFYRDDRLDAFVEALSEELLEAEEGWTDG